MRRQWDILKINRKRGIMKLIGNMLCRTRYKAQTKVKRWFSKIFVPVKNKVISRKRERGKA